MLNAVKHLASSAVKPCPRALHFPSLRYARGQALEGKLRGEGILPLNCGTNVQSLRSDLRLLFLTFKLMLGRRGRPLIVKKDDALLNL